LPHALLCLNPFKGTLSASAAAAALAAGLRRAGWSAETLPLSDGGPGTLEALKSASGGRMRRARARDPLGRTRSALWLSLSRREAVLESAQVLGQALCPPSRLHALAASSEGLGQLLLRLHALGVRRVWVGLGGSATTDGGSGMARALGWRFLDAAGRDLAPGGGALRDLRSLLPPPRTALAGMRVRVLCDVDHTLLGTRGAARVFSPQKGAAAADVSRLEAGLRRLAACAAWAGPAQAGDGAAGGLGFGLRAFARAGLVAGAPRLLDLSGFGRRAARADWVLTGEGRLDRQSLAGKLPWAVAQASRAARRPCAAFCGSSALDPAAARAAGFSRVVPAPASAPGAAAKALRAAAFAWARREGARA
jgi:glycerate kinase